MTCFVGVLASMFLASAGPASAKEMTVADVIAPLPCDKVQYAEEAAAAMPSIWTRVPFQGRLTSADQGEIVCTVKPTLKKDFGIVVVEEHFMLGQTPAIIRHGQRKLALHLVTGQGEDGFPTTKERLNCFKYGEDFICDGSPTETAMFTLKTIWRGSNLGGIAFTARIATIDSEENLFRNASHIRPMAVFWAEGNLPLNPVHRQDYDLARFESKPEATLPVMTNITKMPPNTPLELQFIEQANGEEKRQALRMSAGQINTIWTLTQQFVSKLVAAQ